MVSIELLNDFKTQDYSYLAPPIDCLEITHDKRYVMRLVKKKPFRNIFHDVIFSDFELLKKKKYEVYLKQQNFEKPAEYIFPQNRNFHFSILL